MGWMEFVTSLVEATAWPIAVIAIVAAFRGPLASALRERTVDLLEVGPAGIKLSLIDRFLREASEVIEPAAENAIATRTDADEQERLELLRLTEISPNAAVMDAFSRVERALASVANVDEESRFVPVRRLARLAVEQRWFSQGVADSVDDLARVRNAVVHGEGDITEKQAQDYVNLAGALLVLLRADPPVR